MLISKDEILKHGLATKNNLEHAYNALALYQSANQLSYKDMIKLVQTERDFVRDEIIG